MDREQHEGWPRGAGEMAGRIRALEWAATPLGAAEGWSDRLRLMVEQVLANPQVSSLVCGPERILIYNDAAARLYGDRHPAALGRPLPEVFSQGWATVAQLYARVFAGESVTVAAQPLDTRGEGQSADAFDAVLTPVRETDGRVAYVYMIGSEVGARVRAQARLAESEAAYRYLFNALDEAFCTIEVLFDEEERAVDYRFLSVNAVFEQQTGLADPIGRTAREVVPDLEPYWFETYGRIALTGEPERFQHRADALGRWYDVYAFRIGLPEQRQLGVLFNDILPRKRAEAALRESEERQAFLLKLADALRPLTDAVAIEETASRVLGEHLDVDRIAYATIENGDLATITRDYTRPGLPSVAGRYRPHDFDPTVADVLRAGRTIAVREIANDPEINAQARSNYARYGIGALIAVGLRKGGRWVAALLVHSAPRAWKPAEISVVEEVAERTWAAVERARAESALRETEERQTFLLQLSDALRPLSDPAEIQQAALRLLAEKHDVMRAGYLDVHADGDTMTMVAKFEREAVPVPPRIRLSDYGPDIAEHFRAGRTLCVRDAVAECQTEEHRAAHLALDVRSWIIAPLVKSGRLIAIVGVVSRTPRDWTSTEIHLVTDLAERTWDAVQRARSEEALRDSEARFAQFAASSADALWIRDAKTLAMEYVSPAIETIYGVPSDTFVGAPSRWLELIEPEDREGARQHLEGARAGEAVVHEFRIVRPSDGEERWIRNTDFPLRDAQGRVQRIGGIAEDVTDARRATRRLEVLVNELQHRARNLLGVVNSVASRTLVRGGSIDAFQERLQALSRAHGLLSEAGSDAVAVGALVRAELAAHADDTADRVEIAGPPVLLTARQVQNFTLAVHELTTNAVKYGALANGTGRLAVTWDIVFDSRRRRRLALHWVESGVAVVPGEVARRGYGTELIQEALAYALQAKVDYALGPDGVRCRIEMPIS